MARESESPATVPGERMYTFWKESEILKQSQTAVYPEQYRQLI
jgi:hypothetical protein